jgi:TetR/AcrR family transcriptional repressor of nem operon
MARYRQGHAGETHARIVAGASAMMRGRGLDKASVAEVMKAAGLTVGGFYAQFADKDAMLAEAMASAIAESPPRFRFLTAKAQAEGDPGIVAAYYLHDSRVANLEKGCAAAALVSELHRAPDGVREAFRDGSRECAALLAGMFGQNRDGGPAWAAYALLVGALALIRAMPDDGTREAIRREAVAALRRLASGDEAPDAGPPAA